MQPERVREHATMLTGRLAAVPSLAPPRNNLPTESDLDIVRQRPHVEGAARRFLPLAVDAAMLALATLATMSVSKALNPPPAPLAWNAFFSVLVIGLFAARGFYDPRLRPHLLDDIRLITSASAVATMAVISVRVVLTDDVHTASQTAQAFFVAVGCLVAGRAALASARARAISRGVGGRPTLIVGAGRVGNQVARRLIERPEFGLRPVGFLDNDPMEVNGARTPLPVLGASWDLEEVIAERNVEHVIFTFSTAPHNVLLGMIRRCQERGVSTLLVPRLFEVAVERVNVEHIGGMPLFSMRPANPRGWQFAVKYTIDRIVAALLLVVIAPLLAAIALAVKLSVGSPILFRQKRVGLDGQGFDILKFRSMKHPSPAPNGFALSLAGDSAPGGVEGEDRRTRVGRFLRATSLDELPQLINVLRGEMSLIGPRPERPEFAELFGEDVHRYSDRHRVKSGITGWAQINGLRGKTSISDRAEWDNFYIENWSLWLDFKIALMTLPCLVRGAAE